MTDHAELVERREIVEREAVADMTVYRDLEGVVRAFAIVRSVDGLDPGSYPLYAGPDAIAALQQESLRAPLTGPIRVAGFEHRLDGVGVSLLKIDGKTFTADEVRSALAHPLHQPAPEAGVIEEAKFLIDRLDELEQVILADEDVYRNFAGHVLPSIARLKRLIAAPAPEPQAPVPDGVTNKHHLQARIKQQRRELRRLSRQIEYMRMIVRTASYERDAALNERSR